MSEYGEPWGIETHPWNCHETATFHGKADASFGQYQAIILCWIGKDELNDDKREACWHCDTKDAQRIVACVNACAGIPTAKLIDGVISRAIAYCESCDIGLDDL